MIKSNITQLPLLAFARELGKAVQCLYYGASHHVLDGTVWDKRLSRTQGSLINQGRLRQSSNAIAARADIVLTKDGEKLKPWVVGLNPFGPGRGLVGSGLLGDEVGRYFSPFKDWYGSFAKGKRILYAGASDHWQNERAYFAKGLAELPVENEAPVNIEAVDIDTLGEIATDTVIDRMFQTYESKGHRRQIGWPDVVVPCETWIGTEAILALPHDPSLEFSFAPYMGKEAFAFLKGCTPETVMLHSDRGRELLASGERLLIKNGDVNCHDSCFGRGVGFTDLVHPNGPNTGEGFGTNPVLQRIVESFNAAPLFDRTVRNGRVCDPTLCGFPGDIPARSADMIYGRLSIFLLMARTAQKVFVPPFGGMVMGPDLICHHGKQSVTIPIELV